MLYVQQVHVMYFSSAANGTAVARAGASDSLCLNVTVTRSIRELNINLLLLNITLLRTINFVGGLL